MSNTKVIPIVVPVFNAVEYTKQFIESLQKTTIDGSYKVVIVDNGSTDGTKEYLSSLVKVYGDSIYAFSLDKNLGFAGGVNQGLSAISTWDWDHCVVVNNDVILTHGWLDNLKDCIEHSDLPYVGAVGPVSNMAGGSQLVMVDYGQVNFNTVNAFSKRHYAQNKYRWDEAGYLVGLCWMMSRQFFETVGYLDESFGIGQWEDNDYFLRGQLAGFRYIIDRSTFIHHFFHKTFEKLDSTIDHRGLFNTNKTLFLNKYNSVGGIYDKIAIGNYEDRGQTPKYLEDGHVKKYIVGACRVRDGEKYLQKTLERVSQLCDEIVIKVDNRTTDNTIEICKKFPKVTEIQVEKSVLLEWEARRDLINLAYSKKPDWIFAFDADEVPDLGILADRDQLTNPIKPETHLWIFTVVQLWSEKEWRVDGLWGTFVQGRMFRALPGKIIGEGVLHCGSTPAFPMENIRRSYRRIIHYGNCDATTRVKKYEHYTAIDTDKDLGRILGGWKDYYWRLYYGNPKEAIDPRFVDWKAVPDETVDLKYGQFRYADLYRHLLDDETVKVLPFDETNTVTLCMLAKNEANFLPKCIGSVAPIVSEVVVVDTGSIDGTKDIAEQLGAKVYDFTWCDDFSKARNFAMSKVTSKWLLRLDPDEILPYQFLFGVYKLTQSNMDGYLFPIHNYLQPPRDLNDPNWVLSETTRLFLMQPGVEFRGFVHEEIDDSLREIGRARVAGTDKPELESLRIERVPYFIQHFGYLRDSAFLEKKFEFYFNLSKRQIEQDPSDPRPYFNGAVHLLHKNRLDEAIEWYKKVIKLDPSDWKAHNDIAVIYWKIGQISKAYTWMLDTRKLMNNTVHPVLVKKVEDNLMALRTVMFGDVAL